MFISYQDLIILRAVEQAGSFTAAALTLYRTRSAVTQAIKKIEFQVGFDIFDRTTYRPTFTDKGQNLLKRATVVLEGMEILKKDISMIRDGCETEIALSYDDILDTTPLFTLLAKFQTLHPQVSITLHREVMNGCWDSLLEGRATLTIGVTGESPPGLAVHQLSLGVVDFVFAVARGHPLSKIDEVTTDDVRHYPPVVISDTSLRLARRSSGLLLSDQQIIVPTMDEKIKAQVHGLGVGYLPRHLIEHHLADRTLIAIPLSDQAPKRVFIKAAWIADQKRPALDWLIRNLSDLKVGSTEGR